MKASDLIGRPVFESGGRQVGIVTDLRCVQDGPVRGSMAAPRVHSVIVSGRRTGSMLGYDRRDQQGPWLIRVIVRWLHRKSTIVAWESLRLSDDASGALTVVLTDR
jgi:sporulation protein YlmC with PRC-barrel domain